MHAMYSYTRIPLLYTPTSPASLHLISLISLSLSLSLTLSLSLHLLMHTHTTIQIVESS